AGNGIGNIALLSYSIVNGYSWAIPIVMGSSIVTVLGGAPDDDLGVARWPAMLSPSLPTTLDTTIVHWPGQASYVPAVATARGSVLLIAWGPAPKGRIRIARVTFPPSPERGD